MKRLHRVVPLHLYFDKPTFSKFDINSFVLFLEILL